MFLGANNMRCVLSVPSVGLVIGLLVSWSATAVAQRPIYEPPSVPVSKLLEETAQLRSMPEEQMLALVPTQSGLNYVDCPNCENGRQENQLTWSVDRPDKVICKYCRHEYPSDKFPMTKSVKVQTPARGSAEYPYWEDATGYRYFFAAKRDDLQRKYMAEQAYALALLYQRTGDEVYARRACLILKRFADVFPNWCFHYDYPFKQKEIVDGPISPSQYRPGFRTARWTWWAYSDIPMDLLKAYDWLAGSRAMVELSKQTGTDVASHIQQDLLLSACQQVLDNPETYSNMSPRAWQGLAMAGRITHKPEYVHHVMRCMDEMVRRNFFYDGKWCEGSPDYESQTVGGLQKVMEAVSGHQDPPGYRDPVDGKHYDKISFAARDGAGAGAGDALQDTAQALNLALNTPRMLLPNGRSLPIHDTWSDSKHSPPTSNESRLWPGLGHARISASQSPSTAKNAGAKDMQVHLTWSGGYGHSHGDNLSLLLYSRGREVLSDLGYTHTAYRGWTLATAAHNTVVVDGLNQSLGNINQPTDGRLIYSQLDDQQFNAVIADGSRGYAGRVKRYERSLIMVTSPSTEPYVVDLFEIEGGRTHDYFLHGWADGSSQLTTSLELQPRKSLLPDGQSWQPPKNEGQSGLVAQPHYAYGFLNRLQSANITNTQPIQADFSCQTQAALGPSTLQVRLFPEPNSELVIGENPSIRQAGENDSRLDAYQRPFLMLRHNSEGASRFLAVMEEFADRSSIQAVENLSSDRGVVVKVQLKPGSQTEQSEEHWIMLNVREPFDIAVGKRRYSFLGRLGFLSRRGDSVERISCGGQAVWKADDKEVISSVEEQSRVVSLADGVLQVERTGRSLPSGTAILQTEDGWSYPIFVEDANENAGHVTVRSKELLAFEFDPQKQHLQGKMFPHRQHQGKVSLTWSTHTSR